MAFACTPWEITHNEDLDEPTVDQAAAVVRVRDPRDPTGRRIIEVERPAVHPPRPRADPGLDDPVHGHVPARRLDAPAGQHALPLDRRRQRRGGAWPGPLPDRLPGLRADGRPGPDRGQPEFR